MKLCPTPQQPIRKKPLNAAAAVEPVAMVATQAAANWETTIADAAFIAGVAAVASIVVASGPAASFNLTKQRLRNVSQKPFSSYVNLQARIITAENIYWRTSNSPVTTEKLLLFHVPNIKLLQHTAGLFDIQMMWLKRLSAITAS